jgi:hypothetical protein
MSILKLSASQDTTITNGFKSDSLTRAVYANMGAADSLEMYSSYYSGSTDIEPQLSRILLKFDIVTLAAKRTAGILPASGSVNFILKLSNVEHPYTVPKNFTALIAPISRSWNEGTGLDQDNYTDSGYDGSTGYGANWEYASEEFWTTSGGDVITGSEYAKSFYFDNGTEDLVVDVTNIVEDQIAGTIPDAGIAVLLSGSFENPTEGTDYYTKKFSARSSEYFFKRPALEARWSALNTDDRGEFYFSSPNLSNSDNEQNIYFYNRVNGTLKDLPAAVIPSLNIKNSSSASLGSGSVTKVSTGVYKGTITITGSLDDTIYDTWSSGSTVYYTGEIEANVRDFEDSATQEEFIFSITNIKSVYGSQERPTLKIYSRQKDWSPTIYTVSNNTIENYAHKNLYYKVFRIVDGYTVIDYGIEPVAYTQCSYDKNGNYFDLDMSLFEPGYAYAVKLMLYEDGLKKEFPSIYRFKVE